MRLKADLHIHSTYSDGEPSPQEILLWSTQKGLNVISITDHDTFAGSIKASKLAASYDVLVIIGIEVRTLEGDILVYCEEPLDRIPKRALELLDYAHDNSCVVVPAHPFDIRRHGIGELVYKGEWDAIEIFNAYSDPWANHRAKLAAKELGLPGLASSDAHVAAAIGSAYTIIEVDDYSIEGVLEAIRRGNTIPVPGRPSAKGLLNTIVWSFKRRFKGGDEDIYDNEDYYSY